MKLTFDHHGNCTIETGSIDNIYKDTEMTPVGQILHEINLFNFQICMLFLSDLLPWKPEYFNFPKAEFSIIPFLQNCRVWAFIWYQNIPVIMDFRVGQKSCQFLLTYYNWKPFQISRNGIFNKQVYDVISRIICTPSDDINVMPLINGGIMFIEESLKGPSDQCRSLGLMGVLRGWEG